MAGPRHLYRWLVRRLPPPAAWALWRAAILAASPRRRRVPPPEVALARAAWGVSEENLAATIEEVLSAAGDPSRALVITDSDAVHVAAARGCRLEYVPPREDWLQATPDGDYEAFLAARAGAIRHAYRIGRLELSDDSPNALRRGLTKGC